MASAGVFLQEVTTNPGSPGFYKHQPSFPVCPVPTWESLPLCLCKNLFVAFPLLGLALAVPSAVLISSGCAGEDT